MNMQFIRTLIDKKIISPTEWRFLESLLISMSLYLIWAGMEWKLLSVQWLVQSICMPIWLTLNKVNRDINKNIKWQ